MNLSIAEIQKKIEEVERRLQEAEVLNEMLGKYLQELSFLYEFSRKLNQANGSREVYTVLAKTLKNRFQITEFVLFRFNEKTQLLEIAYARGFTRVGIKDLFYQPDEGIVGRCYTKNKSVYIPHIEKFKRLSYLFISGKAKGSLFYIPIREELKTPIGVLKLKKSLPDAFPDEERKLLFSLSEPLAQTLIKAEERDRTARSRLLDEQTGFYNKRYFPLALEREFKRAQRYRHPLSIIHIKIKNKSALKKAIGSSDFPQILKNLTRNLALNIRRSDIPIRFGTDAFFFLLPETGHESALRTAKKLHQVIQQTFSSALTNNHMLPDIVKIGVGSYPHDSIEPDQLVELAKQPRKEFEHESIPDKKA